MSTFYYRPKPKTVVDVIGKKEVDPFKSRERRINLKNQFSGWRVAICSYSPTIAKGVALLFAVTILSGAGVYAPSISQPSLAALDENTDERQALEEELTKVEKQIEEYETSIAGFKTQAKTLKEELKRLDAKIAQFNLRIKAASLSLEKVNREIAETQSQINVTEGEIQFNKEALADSLRVIHQEETASLVEILLRRPKLSDFFGEINSLIAVQENTRLALSKVTELKNQLLDQRETLSLERSDVIALKEFNESQRTALGDTKSQKDSLLKTTQGKESKYQGLLKESIKLASQIRSRIFQLLGGGELTFEEALKLAQLAERTTGVRAAFILAILDRESALGTNVGKCGYKTAMHPKRDIPIFLEIIKELGLQKNLEDGIIKVSCPNADGAYGGAMGPAQFIPSTWAVYKEKVVLAGGSNPPSPWNNADAFLATALYLKDLGADTGIAAAERQAAAKYYAGGRWRRYLWTYGDWVVNKAAAYQKDIALLTG